MKIKLKEALDLLNSADVVKLRDNGFYIHPEYIGIEEETGKPDNRVVYFGWENEGQEFCICVNEEGNDEVERDGHKLFFKDNEGEIVEFQIFREVPILV